MLIRKSASFPQAHWGLLASARRAITDHSRGGQDRSRFVGRLVKVGRPVHLITTNPYNGEKALPPLRGSIANPERIYRPAPFRCSETGAPFLLPCRLA
jgi:hypothetical protein